MERLEEHGHLVQLEVRSAHHVRVEGAILRVRRTQQHAQAVCNKLDRYARQLGVGLGDSVSERREEPVDLATLDEGRSGLEKTH